MIKINDRVFITKLHPWGESLGVYIKNEKIPFGIKPRVKLDSGKEILIMKPEQWKRIKS